MHVAADICELPVRFAARGDVSVLKLLDESGYGHDRGSISVDVVFAYLAQHPNLVNAWLGYSADKRVSSGWYFKETPGNMFEVGYYPAGERLSIGDRTRACAEFIVREVRAIAG